MCEENNQLVRDIAFFTNASFMHAGKESRKLHVPIINRIQITDEISIQRLPKNLWDRVADSCTLGGLLDATRQFTQLYAFVRELHSWPEGPDRIAWDHDERLQLCIGLSRIVHPTSISFKYSGRVIYEDSKIIEVIPGPATGFGAHAWLSRDDCRDWLTEDDAGEISTLVTAYFAPESQLCTRVRQALWYLEYAYRTFLLDIRWPLVCMGLESLVHTDMWGSTKQFAKRVTKIAEQVGIPEFPEDKAREAYEMRSALVHGQLLRDMDQTKLELYEKAESILRLAIKSAILEPSYNLIFSCDDKIRENFPIT
jgi:hypothetical protein